MKNIFIIYNNNNEIVHLTHKSKIVNIFQNFGNKYIIKEFHYGKEFDDGIFNLLNKDGEFIKTFSVLSIEEKIRNNFLNKMVESFDNSIISYEKKKFNEINIHVKNFIINNNFDGIKILYKIFLSYFSFISLLSILNILFPSFIFIFLLFYIFILTFLIKYLYLIVDYNDIIVIVKKYHE